MLAIDPQVARSAWTRSLIYASVLAGTLVAYFVRKTLLAFAIALLFTHLLYPLVDAIDRRLKWKSRVPAVVFPFGILLLALVAIGALMKAPLQRESAQLRAEISSPDFKKDLTSIKLFDFPLGEAMTNNFSQTQVLSAFEQVSPQLSKGIRAVTRDLVNVVIVPLLSFFLLKDGRRLLSRVLCVLRMDCDAADRVLRNAHFLLLDYMRSLLLLCLATLVFFLIAFNLMRVPYPVLLSLLAFPLEFVPVAGPLAAAVIILCVGAFNHYAHIPSLLAFLVLYRIFQDYVLSPHLMNRGVKLHPLIVILGVFAGGEIGGIAGIFLSVPILALCRLMVTEFSDRHRGSAKSFVPERTTAPAVAVLSAM